jgi:ABC-2 type transport system ATP-binding protein
MDRAPLLALRRATKIYRRANTEVTALQALDLELSPGELVGLLGPNGSGKTTAVKLMTGLCTADEGEMAWRGQPVALGQHAAHLRELGVLLEGRGASYERLSTLENARYFCRLREAHFDRGHFDALAALLDVPDIHAPIRQLSTGNKLRASLLGAMVHRPALVLLDEPTLGLDLFGVERLEALVRHTAQGGSAVLLGSHDLHFVERLSQRIVCLRQGRKVFDGSQREFLHIDHAVLLMLDCGGQPPPALPASLNVPAWQAQADGSPGCWQLPLRDHAQVCAVLAALQPSLPAQRGLQLRQVSLRDKYLQLVGDTA